MNARRVMLEKSAEKKSFVRDLLKKDPSISYDKITLQVKKKFGDGMGKDTISKLKAELQQPEKPQPTAAPQEAAPSVWSVLSKHPDVGPLVRSMVAAGVRSVSMKDGAVLDLEQLCREISGR